MVVRLRSADCCKTCEHISDERIGDTYLCARHNIWVYHWSICDDFVRWKPSRKRKSSDEG